MPFPKQPRKFTDEEYEQELEAARAKEGGLGRNRSGVYESLESLANEMLRRSLVGVTKYKDKSDILTPWKEQMRQRREVLTSSGFPDASIRKGMYKKVANAKNGELNCLSGDTEVLVRNQGLMRIEDLEGLVVPLLTSAGWGKGEIHHFGVQPLYEITLVRNSNEFKTVKATADHRWYVKGSTGHKGKNGLPECTTADLAPGAALASRRPARLVIQTSPSPYGVAHGVTYGDGSRKTSRPGSMSGGAYVDLFGEKVQLAKFFPQPRMLGDGYHDVSVDHVQIPDLPRFFKDRPSIEESVSYLYGWLAGYFATDGSVKQGTGYCLMSSARRSDMEFFRNVCWRLGIQANQVRVRESNSAYTGEPHAMYEISINKWDLTEKFFVREDQRSRWVEATKGKRADLDWKVVSVKPCEENDTYCAVVPETEDFVLADALLTGNSREGIARARTRSSTNIHSEQYHGTKREEG